jgi:hypothetical protein
MPSPHQHGTLPSRPLPRRFAALVTLTLAAVAAALPAACGGDDAPLSPPVEQLAGGASSNGAARSDSAGGVGSGGGARSDSARSDSARSDSTRADTARVDSTRGTQGGAVAGIRLAPRQLVLPVGRAAVVGVLPVDANGVPSLAQLSRVAYSVADARVATVDADSGIVTGRAMGTTKLYARVGAMTDSAVVTVVADTTRPATPPPPGIRIYLRSVTAFTGRTSNIGATVYDASGRPTRAPGKQATWRVGDERVARLGTPTTASDTAFVVPLTGVAPGTTKLYATLDGVTDSVPVTVITLRDSASTNPTPPAPVASFNLTALVFAPGTPPAGSRDTAFSAPYAGAKVAVYRYVRDGSASGPRDSLGTRVLVTSATSDAAGQTVFRNLPSGYYVVIASPVAGGLLGEAVVTFGPPYQSEVRLGIFLPVMRPGS